MGSQNQTPQNVSTTTTTQLPDWAAPYAKTALERANELSQRPYEFYGNATAPLTDLQMQGIDLGQYRALTGAPDINAARQEYAKTVGGDYLSPATNPYLDATYNRAARAVTDQYTNAIAPAQMAQAARARALGNTGFQESMNQGRYALGENLGNLATDIYGGNYNAERGRQTAALGLAPAFGNLDYADANALLQYGGVQQQNQQDQLTQAYNEFQNARMQPYTGLQYLSGILPTAVGNQGTSVNQQPYFAPSRSVGALGGGVTGYQLASLAGANPWLGALGGGLLGGFL